MTTPSVTIVTPWLNKLELADGYWDALRGQRCDVLVIDNGSDPPLPNGVRVGFNSGFSHACNVGLRLARTDAVVFLNNDVAMRDRGWFETLRAAFKPGVLVGAQLRNDLHAAVDGIRMPYLDGWCLGGMRDDLLDLGGWDETFDEPSYYGDNDLCLRARAAGLELREVKVGLRHLINGTAKPDDPRVQAATAANRARYESLARELIGAPVG